MIYTPHHIKGNAHALWYNVSYYICEHKQHVDMYVYIHLYTYMCVCLPTLREDTQMYVYITDMDR